MMQIPLDGMSAHLCVLDDAGRIIAVNAAWRSFCAANGGDPKANYIGSNYLEICDRAAERGCEDALAFAAGLRRVMRREIVDFETEYSCHSPDEERWFSVRALQVDHKGQPRVVVEHQNITAPRLSQMRLEETATQHQMLFQNNLDGVLQTRPDGTIVAANPAACAILGMSEAEICRRGRQGITLAADERLQSGLARRAKVGRARGEIAMIRGDGTRFDAEIASFLFLDSHGQQNACVVLRDISERHRAEQRHKGLEEQLREAQKMESIGTLAGGIAHDFNNILAAILGSVSLLKDELAPGSSAVQGLEQIAKAAQRGRDLVHRLLSVSRGQTSAPKDQVQDLVPVLEEVQALLRATIPHNVDVRLLQAGEGLVVGVGAAQLQQIFLNLGINAWHAMRGGSGQVQLRGEAVVLAAADIPAGLGLAGGAYAVVSVSDDGCGMTAATRARIFEPFFTTKPAGEGTGLGLSVVHGIVLEHGGAVEVQSEPNRGTTFKVWLPLMAAPSPPEPDAIAAVAQEGTGQTIFHVDDDEMMRVVIGRLLVRQGYRVCSFASALDATRALRADPAAVDLVLSDQNMPDRSGLDFAADLRAIRAQLPIVIATGFLDDGYAAHAARAGVNAVLQKDRVMEDLGRVVSQALQKSQLG
jgi:PAS domain S-box-containing protein